MVVDRRRTGWKRWQFWASLRHKLGNHKEVAMGNPNWDRLTALALRNAAKMVPLSREEREKLEKQLKKLEEK